MRCKVTFRHMKASDSIRTYVEEKVSKLDRLVSEERSEVHVVISIEKLQHIAHFELIIAGALRVRADDRSDNIRTSIDVAIDKMVAQVKRYRSKTKKEHHRAEAHKLREVPYQVISLPSLAEDEAEAAANSPQVTRHERIVAQEMHLNDAVEQMDLLNSDFLVFTDSESQKMNVMYRLPDGQFGLIETQSAESA